MAANKNIHYFSRNIRPKNEQVMEKSGLRGKQALEFASLDLPILPGFIIDAEIAAHLEDFDFKKEAGIHLKKFEDVVKKRFDDPDNPLLLKIVISPNLAIVHYPTLHNFGLTDDTIPGFCGFVGETFGYHEVLFMLHGFLEIELKIAELEKKEKQRQELNRAIGELKKILEGDAGAKELKAAFAKFRGLLPREFFTSAFSQMQTALQRISLMLKLDDLDDEDAAIMVQPMVYGNYGKDSSSGSFYTRDIVSGEDLLQGWYNQNEFDTIDIEGKDINEIGSGFLKDLKKIAKTVEDHFKEIRFIRFTIENKQVWLIEQRPVMTKSTQADLKTLLDLHNRRIVDQEYLIKGIKPAQLNEILHPVVDIKSIKDFEEISGGISGAPGAAVGRVYFTTEGLLEAYKTAQLEGMDTKFILCMPATFAEDVKAIEVATGVLSSEGGYSAHASVVARQYGKVSLVKPEMRITGKKAVIDKVTVKEGDYITMNVPHYGDPQIFIGKASLIEPSPEGSGLLEYIDIVKNFTKDFHVRVNADNPHDAELAVRFGAQGIGLCRTEHMFFDEKRINVFRELIISDNTSDREGALKKLKKMQVQDFSGIFRAMDGKEVTIRLLDAPLHEFLPHNDAEMGYFLEYIKGQKKYQDLSQKEIRYRCDSLREFNPMLGHRGCRIAVSYPEIYRMQIEAIFEAAYALRDEKIKVLPEIMIPLIMNADELKLIVYGKKIEGDTYEGLTSVAEAIRKEKGGKELPYKIGTMIELPAAALSAGEIARYAEFFSFGTNDLTQTSLGLSRDDFNSFMPDYTQFDILNGNPFQQLDKNVKELIQTAVRRGLMTRPGLSKGICGEHGAVPENISFCMEAGLDYVSCSVYSVPIAMLAVAQLELERQEAAAG
ncbi:pyruvate, phosphate dikinase [Marispirochaeta aestuarii]|uniref:Pyruvate, phosphate dikinase n=1 Tax=Marispirochaeta aestuarii TaxID=1963862 RepID=A0A1Y1S1J7_9SPIO|nr:putative PEP-binding protein [Marispirochaeta aestuarii]ORC37313.1 pyruvate, phosphate dikinase [Marispirochaeta aestuarii]